ncbi:hypothetical protein DdX_11220 [Ditylenchus destructor]|uniref:Uncharacterized protein n=1 Tax=Ditylenchus destructor TaxID=166010 RepID=A0AAD4R4N6_9BILA|nr:hypothetical protein DdX_11220 [Ditylenchus destructor]
MTCRYSAKVTLCYVASLSLLSYVEKVQSLRRNFAYYGNTTMFEFATDKVDADIIVATFRLSGNARYRDTLDRSGKWGIVG